MRPERKNPRKIKKIVSFTNFLLNTDFSMQVIQEKVPVVKINTGPSNPDQRCAATQTVEFEQRAEF